MARPFGPLRLSRVSGLTRLTLLACAALAAASAPAAQERPLPDFATFTAQVRSRLQTDEDLQTGYSFTERRTEQKLDGAGRVSDQKVKVFEVYPGLPGEERYRRLVEEDGRPVPARDLERKDRERQRKVEQYARTTAAPSEAERRRQTREREKALKERTEAIDDIFNVFTVRMVGREPVEGHDTIVFTLTPRGVKPRTDSGEMMRHFSARAWISESDYELVKVDVEAIDTVSFGLGLLARLHKGATASYQRRKVNGEIWLPAKVTYRGSGRVLLVRQMRLSGISEFSNYRKFGVDTTTTIGGSGQ